MGGSRQADCTVVLRLLKKQWSSSSLVTLLVVSNLLTFCVFLLLAEPHLLLEYRHLPVHSPSPAVRRDDHYTQSLPGPDNLCLHRCTFYPHSQIQPKPLKSSLKLPDQTVLITLHYSGLK
ncbi:hypothetical protein CHARACLAT_031552 [Characodon lateralis]|uniref:Uncharacterized protein n=1 Tax=Characodon lateralis TaxID=208331 RepID=A0ABU7E572_9TELE|nr:hypothetical protein [Characodon lateralis]